MSNNPKMMLSVSLVVMWIVYLTCMSIIIHNTSGKGDNVYIYYLAVFGFIGTIVTPFGFFFTDPIFDKDNSKIYKPKIYSQLALPLVSLFLLIFLSIEHGRDNLTNEEKERIKTSQNAAISMFVISVIFYGVIGGLYYKGGEAMSKEIKTIFIEKIPKKK